MIGLADVEDPELRENLRTMGFTDIFTIEKESGTVKELVARAIHKLSPRRSLRDRVGRTSGDASPGG